MVILHEGFEFGKLASFFFPKDSSNLSLYDACVNVVAATQITKLKYCQYPHEAKLILFLRCKLSKTEVIFPRCYTCKEYCVSLYSFVEWKR